MDGQQGASVIVGQTLLTIRLASDLQQLIRGVEFIRAPEKDLRASAQRLLDDPVPIVVSQLESGTIWVGMRDQPISRIEFEGVRAGSTVGDSNQAPPDVIVVVDRPPLRRFE